MYDNGSKIKETLITVAVLLVVSVLVVGLLTGLMFGWQWFKVYAREQSGRAQLAEATYSKQVQLEEAKANLDSQKLNSQAEVERAKGAAEAMRIENGQLTDEYIRYLYVQNLEKLDTQMIYVPTEGGLPLLEATRLGREQ